SLHFSTQCFDSPSTCHPSSSLGPYSLPSPSSVPRLTMKESLHVLLLSVTRASPPARSQMAPHALGANSATLRRRCSGMLVRSRVHVALSVGDIPSRVHTSRVHDSAAALLKHSRTTT